MKNTTTTLTNAANITITYPCWAVVCRKCGAEVRISFKPYKMKSTNQRKKRNGPSLEKKAESGAIKEYTVQMYLKENAEKLGIKNIKGPYDRGPDFRGTFNGKNVGIEVEKIQAYFIQHKHHLDKRFSNVILVVLGTKEVSEDKRELLPKTIINIDSNDFCFWLRKRAKVFYSDKRIPDIVKGIAASFHRLYRASCQYKDDQMATCPDCDLCAYFGQGAFHESAIVFSKMSLDFINHHKLSIKDDGFDHFEIEDHVFYDFFMQYEPML